MHHIRDILAISAHQPHHPNELYAKQWYASVATVQSAVIDLLRGTRRVRHIVGHHIINRTQARRTVSHPSSSMGKSRHLLPAGAFSSPFMRRITPRCNCSPTRCLRNRSQRPRSRLSASSAHRRLSVCTSPSENAGGGSSRGEKTPKFPVFHILKSPQKCKAPSNVSVFPGQIFPLSPKPRDDRGKTGNFGVKPSAWPHFVRLEQSASGPRYVGPTPFRTTLGETQASRARPPSERGPSSALCQVSAFRPKTAPSREPACDPPQATADPAQ